VVALASIASSAAHAQAAYPAKPIRIITSGAGGGSDFAARLIAQGLTTSLGQQVIVENRGGGSGIIAAQMLTRSPPDGHTMLLFASSIWLLPFLQDNVPYDPVRDLAPISLTDSSPIVLVVHPSLPVKSVRELITFAKARAGQLNYSRGSAGSPTHLAAELFKSMAGLKITSVPYKGNGPATLALLSGEVELSFVSLGAAAASIKANRLRPLGVASAEPSRLFPELPTIASSGLRGYEAVLVNGMFAPAGTPPPIINRVSQEVGQLLGRPEVKERFFSAGVEAVGSSPERLASTVKGDMAKWGKLIASVGIRAD
jgi:tripartite-type tricarboxylate transporter receptor subunit TctC